MEKVGLIADIHADLNGLRQALECLARLNVDHILCAGDLVEKGTDGDAVVALLRQRQIPCVRGNHDHDAIANQKYLRDHLGANPDFSGIMPLARRELSDETCDFLEHLEGMLILNRGDTQICVAHGTPWSDVQYVYPTSQRHIFARVVSYSSADVVILGHTHIPMVVRIAGALVINPGSVCGAQSSGSRTCAVLTLPDGADPVGQVNHYDIRTGQPVSVDTIAWEM